MIRQIHYIVLCLLFLTACKKEVEKNFPADKQTSFERIMQQEELRVVFLNNSISYFLYRGTPMGFHYELAEHYAKSRGLRLRIQIASDMKTALKMLKDGNCDLLAASVKMTGERKKECFFTSPLFQSYPVLVQNKESKKQFLEDWLDVDTIKLHLVDNSLNRLLAEHLQESLALDFKVVYHSEISGEDLLEAVALDSIPATFSDKIKVKVAQTYYPNLDASIPAGLPCNISWAVNYNAPELALNIDKWLSKFRKSREFRMLYTKYFRNKKSILRNKTALSLSKKQLSPYDTLIQKEAKVMGWDWRFLAALIYTESRFDPKQVSWAGAFGIMQMMPLTAKNFGASRYSSVGVQLEAGRKYLEHLQKRFAVDMEDKADLPYFVVAAYNSGDGHIVDAQNLAEKYDKNKFSWDEVAPFLDSLKKPKFYKDAVVKHGYFCSRETRLHVARIQRVYESYKVLIPE